MLLFTGALTSKPYAFTSRPWELRSVQSLDILDGVGSNIRVDFKETEIVRVLPRRNPEINENWISDKIRFFYDGIKRQRINSPYLKFNGELLSVKWTKVLSRISAAVKVFSFEYGPSKVGILTGSSLEIETLFALKNFSSNFGFSLLGTDNFFKANIDNPSSFKFQNRLIDLDNVDFCLLVGTNPRFEASVLNLRLRKIYRKGLITVGSIGGSFSATFPVNFLGLTSNTLLLIAEGKHPVCKTIARSKKPAIIFSSKLLERSDSFGLQNVFQLITKTFENSLGKDLFCSVLHTESNSVGALELGLHSLRLDDLNNMKFIFAVGVENISLLNTIKDSLHKKILILQNCTGQSFTNNADLILPSTSFLENPGVYYNIEGRPQKTQRIFVGPNLARDSWKILSMLYQSLSKVPNYYSKSQLNTEVCRILPSFFFADSWFNQKGLLSRSLFDFGLIYPELFYNSSFKLFIEDFFMTHTLCRASKVMAKASQSLRSYSTNYGFFNYVKN